MNLYDRALRIIDLDKVGRKHPILPYMLMLKGSLFSLKGKYKEAITNFRECVKASDGRFSSVIDKKEKRQLLINRDSCLLGISRSYFGKKDYEKASYYYLDIEKSSYIWPRNII